MSNNLSAANLGTSNNNARMNGEIPSVPITTLAGIASLTDCESTIFFLFIYCDTINTYVIISM